MAKATENPDVQTEMAPPEAEEYTTRGHTTLATRLGHIFQSSIRTIPDITADGVMMTAEEAKIVLAESVPFGDGYVFEVTDTNTEA